MSRTPFKIPGTTEKLVPFCEELIEQCYASLPRRREMYRYFRSYYYTGSGNGTGSKHNKCFSHIDKLSSLLFSPSEVKFDLSFDGEEVGEFAEMGDTAARYLTKEYFRAKAGLVFGQAVDTALIDGCAITKKVWGYHGPKSYLIRPQFFGVLREDIEDLDEQDAMVQSFYVTPKQLLRLLGFRDGAAALVGRISDSAEKPNTADFDSDYFHEIVMAGLSPITTTGVPSGQRGSVSPYATPSPMLSAEVSASLIRVDDLWVMDDEREDWTTIRYVKPGIILEGNLQHRNLSDIPKEHPFTKVCPNEVPGYFYGASELLTVTALQDLISRRMDDADNILKRQARPSRAYIGFSNITPEKALALMSLDGMLTEDNPNGKIETLAPDMPTELLPWIEYLDGCFDDQAGITNMMQGKGEPGVRSGVQGNQMLRTSTPRLRDRAMLVENQCGDDGDKTFKMLQAKVPKVFKTPGGAQFILEQLPEDATVMVDSHSSSPAFSGDQANQAAMLRKFGSIDDADFLEMQPGLPRKAELVIKARKRDEAKAKLLEQHPELLTKGAGAHKR